MNQRTLLYYTMDHPFEKNEKVIYSDRYKARETISQIYEIDRNDKISAPRIMRVHIEGEGNSGDEKIIEYEKAMKKKENIDYNKAKVHEIMRFSRSLLIGYLLFLAPEAFWNPIVNVFNLVAHGLSDYARWCVIFFLPLKGFIRTFGTLFFIRGKVNLGFPGQWQRINEAAKTLNVYDKLDDSCEKTIELEVTDFLDNLKKKAPEKKELIHKLEDLLKGDLYLIGSEKLDDSLRQVIREEEKGPLWGEMIKLDSLREELYYLLSSDKKELAPILHFEPGSSDLLPTRSTLSSVRLRSFAAQSENLRVFEAMPLVRKKKEDLRDLKDELVHARSNEERISALRRISSALEILRDEASRFHMGENILIPQDKSNAPSLYYHHLFTLCGSALCELEKGYRRTVWGIVPVKSNRAGRKRVELLLRQINRFLYGNSGRIWRDRLANFRASWGRTPSRGLALSFLTLFLAGSVLSFYTVAPGESVTSRTMKLGYKDRFINWETTIERSDSFYLGWHLPRPLSSVSVVNGEKREIIVYLMMGEHFTANPVSRLMSDLSGQLGTKFDVIEMKISYSPGQPEIWSRYNSDGKGERRLLRDLSELAEDWRNSRGNEEATISNREFDLYFRELADKGILEEYLKRSFSQTTFSTNIYYGSLTERYDAGIAAVLREFELTLDRKKNDILTADDEIRTLEESLGRASVIVRDLQDSVEDQVKVEYSLLRSDPELLARLVSDPYGNAQKLKEFETIWINLANYIQYLYKQKELIEILSSGYIDMSLKEEALKLYPVQLKLADFLQENSLIGELIDIKSIEFRSKVIGLTEFTQYQEKWKETI